MIFTPEAGNSLKGLVKGELRLNVSGMGDADDYVTTSGEYRLSERVTRPLPQGGTEPVVTTGAITISWDDVPGVIWDYSLIFTSDISVQIAAGGRMPRPGALIGTMYRLSQ